MSDRFVYVTYIKTAPETLWNALIDPEFNKQYWFGAHQQSDWKTGAEWKLVFADGGIADTGQVVEFDPPKRLVLKWRNEFRPELKDEGYSTCVIEIEPLGELCKLTVDHSIACDHSKFVKAVSGGWPQVLSSLKSLLETGVALPRPEPKCPG